MFFIKVDDNGAIVQVSNDTFDDAVKVKVDDEFAKAFSKEYAQFMYIPGQPIGVCYPKDVQNFRIKVLMESGDTNEELIKKLEETVTKTNDLLAFSSQQLVKLQKSNDNLTQTNNILMKQIAFLGKQFVANQTTKTTSK